MTTINSDSVFRIGKTHKVCQDYAWNGQINGHEIAMVSDGCSGSPHTDIGSRLLIRIAIKALQQMLREGWLSEYRLNHQAAETFYLSVGDRVIHDAKAAAQLIGTTSLCLDATLIIAIADEHGSFVMQFGDGTVITRSKRDEVVIVSSAEFTNNAPYYLSYWNDVMRREMYEKLGTGETAHLEAPGVTFIDRKWFGDGDFSEISETARASCPNFWFPSPLVEDLIISTDGIETFNQIELKEVIDTLTIFKNHKRDFLARRVTMAERKWTEQGISHGDDLGMAAIHFEFEKENDVADNP